MMTASSVVKNDSQLSTVPPFVEETPVIEEKSDGVEK